jgi:hypothetical protein
LGLAAIALQHPLKNFLIGYEITALKFSKGRKAQAKGGGI